MNNEIKEIYRRLNIIRERILKSRFIKINIDSDVRIGNNNYIAEGNTKEYGTKLEPAIIEFIQNECQDIFPYCQREPLGSGKFPDVLLGYYDENNTLKACFVEIKTSDKKQINCGLQHAYTISKAIEQSNKNSICDHLNIPFIVFKYHETKHNEIYLDDIIIKEYWKLIAITDNNTFGFKSKPTKVEGRYFQNFNSFKERYKILSEVSKNYLNDTELLKKLDLNKISKPYNSGDMLNLLIYKYKLK